MNVFAYKKCRDAKFCVSTESYRLIVFYLLFTMIFPVTVLPSSKVTFTK